MDIKKFTLYTLLGCFIWSTFLTYVGYILGENWQAFGGYFRKFEIAIGILLIIAIVWYLEKHFKILKSLRSDK